jgi:hypothetical protein
VFPKTLTGDYKHVGRRLAQRTRANIVAAPKEAVAARARTDICGHESPTHGGEFHGQRRCPAVVISRILNHSEEKDITSVYDRYSYDA